MNIRITCLLLTLILLPSPPSRASEVKAAARKVVDTSWLEQSTLKYGLLTSFVLAQGATGLTEGYHFRQEPTHIINSGNYHAFATVRRASWLATGWFSYANLRDADLRWHQKLARFAGSALISRNAFEWSYKTARYGNPFDYSREHNEHAVVYFGFRDGHLADCYFGTGPVSGPAVDIACLALGIFLFK